MDASSSEKQQEQQHYKHEKDKDDDDNDNEEDKNKDDHDNDDAADYHLILFYQYMALSEDATILSLFVEALRQLCGSLNIVEGRILVGLSNRSEGINGTLASPCRSSLQVFTVALLQDDEFPQLSERHKDICQTFWKARRTFAQRAAIPLPMVQSPLDFKWSTYSSSSSAHPQTMFPDLKLEMVPEIIGTGGQLSDITMDETGVGLLTPQEWHDAMKHHFGSYSKNNDAVLIDCRNSYEVAIGHFPRAINPETRTFEQFPQWVQRHKETLAHKDVYLYCTGGIRCEKASAWIRRETQAQDVFHLQGGIHKYLQQYSEESLFGGKNFVFDQRGVMTPHAAATHAIVVVGRCLYCHSPHDEYRGEDVCTVCRDRVLVCEACRASLHRDYHCRVHFAWRHCYFTALDRFSRAQLQQQVQDLQRLYQPLAVGKSFRNVRRTLQRQIHKVQARLAEQEDPRDGGQGHEPPRTAPCRSCRQVSCQGDCFAFLGYFDKKDPTRRHPQEQQVGGQDS